ncbi:MAG: tetratricopeptide repeat protein [Terriglobia bacterium]
MARAGLIIFLVCAFGAGAFPLRAQARDSARNSATRPNWPFYPSSPKKSVEIGNFYLKRNDDAGALSRFQEAVHGDPHYAPAYLGLGKVYDKMNQRRKALSAYQRYLRELPSDRDAARAKGVHTAIARLEGELGETPPGGSARR